MAAKNRLRFDGLEELRVELRALPRELADDGSLIVSGSAETAASLVRAAYPEKRGKLRLGVKVVKARSGPYGAGVVLVSAARHAHLIEFGTAIRRSRIRKNLGKMRERPIFIPIVQRLRRAMYEQLAELLERHGLRVTNRAAA